jgi:hypothetical protein
MWTFNSILGRIFEILFLPFRSVNPWWGMLMISLLTGILMLVIFKFTSNQAAIRRTKDRIKAHLLEMRLYRDSLSASFKAQGGILKANLRYMSHSIKPLLVMIVPVILILIHLNFWFGYDPVEPGEPVLLKVRLQTGTDPLGLDVGIDPSEGMNIETPPLRIEEESEVDWRLSFDKAGTYSLRIKVGDERVTKTVAVGLQDLNRLSPRRVEKRFWEELFYPTEPPLDPQSRVGRIDVAYESGGLPFLGWRMHWLIAFFVLSIVFGFSLKGVFGVEI